MAVKYRLEVNSQKGDDWLVEIDVPSYVGDPISLIGDRNPILLEELGGANDNPFDDHILTNSLTIRVYDDGIDIQELQLIDDASVRCRAYLNGQMKHQGFVVSDGIQETDSGVASLITIKSIDGLELLDAIPFRWGDNYGTITVDGQLSDQRCPMNAIRLALYRFDLLDNVLPIRWATSLRSQQYPNDDMLAGRNNILPDGKMLDYSSYSARWYLNEIMKTAHCWLYQRDGYWWIENRLDTIRNNGIFNGYEITTSTTSQVATPVSIDLNTPDLANEFIDGDQYWMVKKPLGGVDVVYEDTTNNGNVVPNGELNFTSVGMFVDWGFSFNSTGTATINLYEPAIDGREGYSLDATFPAQSSPPTLPDARVSYLGAVPLDANILFKTAVLGFEFLPLSGFPYYTTGENSGFINWDNQPLRIRVQYVINNGVGDPILVYLNEFGFWQRLPPGGAFLAMAYSGGTNNLTYSFTGYPLAGDAISIRLRYENIGLIGFYPVVHIVSAAEEGSLPLLMANLRLTAISSLPGAWTVTNTASSINITAPVGQLTENGSVTESGSSSLNPDGSIPITIDRMKIGDIASIAFSGRGGSGTLKLPDPGLLPPNTNFGIGKLKIEFFLKEGQRYVIDNVYFRVEDNHDKYELRVSNRKSPVENYEVSISSSFSGHMWSSYGDDYRFTDQAYYWAAYGGAIASLTELYGRAMLDWRNTPRKIFDGSIDRIIQSGDFLTIKGRKYVVMSATIQGDGIAKVLAFEAVLSPTFYSVSHKGTIINNN